MEVLILEDDSALCFALSQALEAIGCRTIPCCDLREAVETLQHRIPDVVLLDLMIGDQMSIAVADIVGYRAPDCKVIYLTGSGRFESGELFTLSNNASWILRKPIDFSDLQSLFQHIDETQQKVIPGQMESCQEMFP